MRKWRLVLRLVGGRTLPLYGTEDGLRVLREVLVELTDQNSEAIISHMDEGRPALVAVPEIESIGKVESVPRKDAKEADTPEDHTSRGSCG